MKFFGIVPFYLVFYSLFFFGCLGNRNDSDFSFKGIFGFPLTSVVGGSGPFKISGTVSGLTGTGLILQLNGNETVNLSLNGVFEFKSQLENQKAYLVTVVSNPVSPNQICSVTNASGLIASRDISDIRVVCSSKAYTVSGSIVGLSGSGLILLNNGADSLGVTGSSFTFSTLVASGGGYAVSVSANPSTPAQVCSVSNSSGTVTTSNITNVLVTCSTNSYTVSGTISGLSGSGFKLKNNGGDEISPSGTSFVFPSAVADGGAYSISVSNQPSSPKQLCSITSGAGVIAGANVSTPSISCVNQYSVGGTVNGLSGSVTLKNLVNSDTFTVTADGNFTMPTGLIASETFNLTVTSNPFGQFCKVAMMYGSIVSSHITDIRVHCQNGTSGPISGGNSILSDLSFLTGNMEVLPPFTNLIFTGKVGINGYSNGIGNAATFNTPGQIATDGKRIFVADTLNDRVRAIEISTRIVSDLFNFSNVKGVATDGVFVYACGENSSNIVKYDLGTGTTYDIVPPNAFGTVDGLLGSAKLNKPNHLSVDGVKIYVSDTGNHKIRMIDQRAGTVNTIAGTGVPGIGSGPAMATPLNSPKGLYLQGNSLFIASTDADAIVKLDLSLSTLSVVAGGNTGSYDSAVGTGAAFSGPTSLISDGSKLYFTDAGSGLIRTISLTSPHPTSTISGCAGKSGTSSGVHYAAPCPSSATTAASFGIPYGITSDGVNIFISDAADHIVRRME
ncbi:hypothetical protein [Leptospira adleri]|uniref:hypothetical protein n=1 Tax=Leptospira adleri TaxID=2023186 RepID=UPI001083B6CA|nr:hypothetical protein [Leptospira adleri]TGM60006.1 hypothetical protein EHQ97_04915 [Leptospira adleri]